MSWVKHWFFSVAIQFCPLDSKARSLNNVLIAFKEVSLLKETTFFFEKLTLCSFLEPFEIWVKSREFSSVQLFFTKLFFLDVDYPVLIQLLRSWSFCWTGISILFRQTFHSFVLWNEISIIFLCIVMRKPILKNERRCVMCLNSFETWQFAGIM